jgi:hypothetical protein
MEWARSNKKGDLVESFYSLVSQSKRSVTPLKSLGIAFLEQGGKFTDEKLAEYTLPDGAEWVPGSKPLRVRIKGYGETTAQAAVRSGALKFNGQPQAS